MLVRTNLAYLRLVRGKLTQRAIAEGTGIGQKTLSALETGASKGIEFTTLAKLCEFLRCTPNDLLILENEPEEIAASAAELEKADALIAKGLSAAMALPPKPVHEVWAEFDAMRLRLQEAAERGAAERKRRA